MLKRLLFGKPKRVTKDQINLENFFGFTRCKITPVNENIKPLHGYLRDGKLDFAYLEGVEMVLFSEELKLGLYQGIYNY